MNRYSLSWNDVLKAAMITLIGNILVMVMGLPDDQLPTLAMLKSNLILSIKLAFIPYLIKNFFSDEVKAAKTVVANDKAKTIAESKG